MERVYLPHIGDIIVVSVSAVKDFWPYVDNGCLEPIQVNYSIKKWWQFWKKRVPTSYVFLVLKSGMETQH